MADAVLYTPAAEEESGYRFSWGLAIAGGVGATATTFLLLTLGAGFGLLLVHPLSNSMPPPSSFFTGGAIYFFASQAFGFAVGGYIAGRLLGQQIEGRAQEEIRAAVHGFIAWAVAVLATFTVVAVAGLMTTSTGVTTAALYGAAQPPNAETTPTAYIVDSLFAPSGSRDSAASDHSAVGASSDQGARAQAARILEASVLRGGQISGEDRSRLVDLISTDTGVTAQDADARIDRMQADTESKTRQTAEAARKIASYASLWIGFSLLFGALAAMSAAIFAREEDDRETVKTR